MKIEYSRKFLKHYESRVVKNSKLFKKFDERVVRFLDNPSDLLLRDHALAGDKLGFRAFWITGDVRVVYKKKDENTIWFFDVGTHNQVY